MRFAPLPIVQQPIKRLLSLSRTKRRTLNYMLAMHTSQEFNINILYQAISIDKPIDRQRFLFYRQELEKTIMFGRRILIKTFIVVLFEDMLLFS
ncbi:unnamed protein product [Rotaria sordida]|uniref:Uncharacterized protein n=1 Tax=Rotaria sordida TaxID=392033 RepID=A0A814V1W4_9BILA|nr:unnamed protein product [Rotaria sordida]CAF4055768.1 unnamed protein product [Rotaria sordida]